jgi:predicted nuclease with TOPRIM domain
VDLIGGREWTAWAVGLALSCLGVWKALRELRRASEERRRACERDNELLHAINKELHPNGGSSLRDRVETTAANLSHLTAQLNLLVGDHDRLHKRIDGLFELIAGPNTSSARRTAGQHRRDRDDT